MTTVTLSRRDFLKAGAMGILSLAGLGVLAGCRDASDTSVLPPTASEPFVPDVIVRLIAHETQLNIQGTQLTDVLQYIGEVLQGDPGIVQPLPNRYLGPTLHFKQGQKVRIIFENRLKSSSNVHWHGLLVPSSMDGLPHHLVSPGDSFTYEFVVNNRAGTYWYHPHAHGSTAAQVYQGLAGLLLVSDVEEQALVLPKNDYDVALVIQDRTFDKAQRLVYLPQDMMTQMMGFQGDQIIVNGQPNPTLDVAQAVYRVRILNGSNARVYKLAFDNQMPITVIASDGGLLTQPLQYSYITLAPAERIEILLDLRKQPLDSILVLHSLAFEGVEAGMGGGHGGHNMMNNNSAIPQGTEYPIISFNVMHTVADTHFTMPERLSELSPLLPIDATNANKPYRIKLSMRNMVWELNERVFEMEKFAQDEVFERGKTYLWEFSNEPGTGMMSDFMAHPMHLHGAQFRIMSRQINDAQRVGWDTLKDGFVDGGWKDTVLVMPGETVQLQVQFTEPGLFLYHCHNLEHESQGMMRHYVVR